MIHEIAKAIPRIFFILLLPLLTVMGVWEPNLSLGASEPAIYYIRLDIRYCDNTIDRSNLLMIPGETDFRSENFTRLIVSGSAEPSTKGPVKDIETRAKHNALKTLLEQHGLTSVKSATQSVNNSSLSSTIISYEGAVKLPFTIINSGYDIQHQQYSVTLDVLFAPTAFPDQWQFLGMKHRLKQWMSGVVSWFNLTP